MTEYEQFLQNKSQLAGNFGFEPEFMPDKMFDFQKYVTDYVIKKGRSAGFIDTGLGKTIIELAVAKNHAFKSGVSIPELAEMFGQTKQSIKKQIDNYRDDILGIRELRITNNYFEYFIRQINSEETHK